MTNALRCALLVAALLLSSAGPVAAQEPEPAPPGMPFPPPELPAPLPVAPPLRPEGVPTNVHPVVAAPVRSAWAARLLELGTPFAGYTYAGNWRAGLWPAAATFAAGGVLVACVDLTRCSTGQEAAGIAVILATRVWAAIGAGNAVVNAPTMLAIQPFGAARSISVAFAF